MKPTDPRTGKRLFEIRQHRDMSQGRLAQAIGVSVGTIQNYEHERVSITTERIMQLARALQCEPADLLMPPGSPPPRYRRPRFAPFPERASSRWYGLNLNHWEPWERWVAIGDDD